MKPVLGTLVWIVCCSIAVAQRPSDTTPIRLDAETADQWAKLVLQGVDTEFPNKLSLVYSGEDQIKTPKEHFPAFYGCFDWHSSVHGHWVLVKLLKEYPEIPSAPMIRAVLARHLTAKNLAKEAEFFAAEEQKSFERMYGWAWFLRLVIELEGFDDERAAQWRENLRPLEKVLVGRIEAYLPLLAYPIRIGQHADTGFALGQILDYAIATGRNDLQQQVRQRAKAYYHSDRDYPIHYEPSGHDFFSSCWNEADLMRRVLAKDAFEQWFDRFVPNLSTQLTDGTVSPVEVSDLSDGKLVHLAGLNLDRAWCMASVARSLRQDHALRQRLLESARAHCRAGLAYINSGHYEGDHWLATFGLYAVDQLGEVDGRK